MRRNVAFSALVTMVLLVALSAAAQNDRTRTLVGKVLDRDERPVANAIVSLKNTRTLVTKTFITHADGAFNFDGLLMNTDYELRAEKEGASTDRKTISVLDPRKRVEIILRLK
jgi:hypothetical protein